MKPSASTSTSAKEAEVRHRETDSSSSSDTELENSVPESEPKETVSDGKDQPGETSSKESSLCAPANDPALWIISPDLVERLVQLGPSHCRNDDGKYEKSLRICSGGDGKAVMRKLTQASFIFKKPNGESVQREWLIYSPSKGAVYCFPCRLFSKDNGAFSTSGYDDWKNASSTIASHEKCEDHKRCALCYFQRRTTSSRIDCSLVKQIEAERSYWITLLDRIINTVKHLASRGLAFRGKDEVGYVTTARFCHVTNVHV